MSNSPMCCGMPANLNVISPRLQFYVCGECRNEVVADAPAEPEESWEELMVWYTERS